MWRWPVGRPAPPANGSASTEPVVEPRPLSGRRVVTTRDEPGRLDSLLARSGADVVHVPLIAIADPPDGGASLVAALSRLDRFDWLIVTSRHGATRVGGAAARHPSVRLAAVGTRTARRLRESAGRAAAVVPAEQTAAALVAALPDPPADGNRVLVVQADRAADTLVTGLQGRGFDVTAVVGYSTRGRTPTPAERAAVRAADAVAFASGSAAASWAAAFGDWTPPVVVAIGPTTGEVAARSGLKVTHVSGEHSIDGLAAEITSVLRRRP